MFVLFSFGKAVTCPQDLHWTADGKKLIFIDARASVSRRMGWTQDETDTVVGEDGTPHL